MLAAVKANCDGEGIGDGLSPLSSSRGWCMAVKGGLSAPGEWWAEPLLMPLVDTRGVAGAVSGNSGGVIFMGRGNSEGRCFLRAKKLRPELCLGVWRGLGVFSNETWPVELPSDRDESDWRGTGSDGVDMDVASASSWADSASAAGGWLEDGRPGASTKLSLLLPKAKAERFTSMLLFLSTDLRRMPGRSSDVGSKERRRRLNCCRRPRFLGGRSSVMSMVGAVVMMAGAGVVEGSFAGCFVASFAGSFAASSAGAL